MDQRSSVINAGRNPTFAHLLLFPILLAVVAGTYSLRAHAAGAAGASPAVAVATPQSVPASAASAPLLRPSDLVYQGAFRLPPGSIGGSSFDYGGTALTFNPARGSLFMVGHDWQQQVAEVSIPTPVIAGTIDELHTATVLQSFTDVTEGRMRSVATDPSITVKVGGLLPYQGKLYATAYIYYDGQGTQAVSHFVSGTDLSVSGDVTGPYQVGTLGAGMVSGYFGLVPSAWQAALGGPVLNGQCCLSIITRTSFGPSAFAIDPAKLGTMNPLPAQPLVYYPAAHPLGPWGGDSLLFNGSTNVDGVVFPENTRSVLFFGRQGVGPWCYGTGTGDPALAGTEAEPGDNYCYDPTESGKGGHGYPYVYYVWAYDALDLAAVKSGERQPWDVKPYAVWKLDLPFERGGPRILGAAYDSATGRIFVSQGNADGDNPLIHVLALGAGTTQPPQPTMNVLSPTDGATFAPLAPITLSATARNANGVASSLSFYANGALIGTGVSPYSFDWTNAADGSYTLTAIATDNLGASISSNPLSIVVKAPSTGVNVALAANGATAVASSTYSGGYGVSGAINGDRKGAPWGVNGGWNDGTPGAFPDWLQVNFSGPKTIDEIDVFSLQDNYQAPVDPTASLTVSLYGLVDFDVQYWDGVQWFPVPGGTVSGNRLAWRRLNFNPLTTSGIRVRVTSATDTWSRITEVEAYQAANRAPTVSLTAPANNATFTPSGSITLSANAADSDGTVSSVAFYANAALIGTVTSSPYRGDWAGAAAGTYQITAVATDNAGLFSTSSAVTIVVRQPSPPTVTLTAPANSATFMAPGPITLTANAADSDGTVSSVAFYANAALIGTTTSSPYRFDWSGVAAGTYQITAVATDNAGLTSTSSAASVVVTAPTARVNVAAAAMGATAVGSSTYNGSYAPSGAINGDRTGAPWGGNAGWNDNTPNTFPDWLEINFGGPKTINEVDVFSVQDSYQAPIVPTPGLTFSLYGLTDFQVQYWDGVQWLAVPGGTVNGNTLVWRQVSFSPLTTSRIRVWITGAGDTWSRVTEVEAYQAPAARVNVASATSGATAVASTTYNSGYAPGGAINGERKGFPWGGNAGWNDNTPSTFSDWLEIRFGGQKTISEIDIFSLQDNYQAPIAPTPGLTFSAYGLTDFQVQYWSAGQWLAVPGGTVSGNTLVWRQVNFSPLTTSRIRVLITGTRDSWSRVTEIEAY